MFSTLQGLTTVLAHAFEDKNPKGGTWKKQKFWVDGEVWEWAAEDTDRRALTGRPRVGTGKGQHPADWSLELLTTWSFPAPNHYPLFWVSCPPASTGWHRHRQDPEAPHLLVLLNWAYRPQRCMMLSRRCLSFRNEIFFFGASFVLLRGLLRGGTVVVIVLVFAVILSA